MWYEYSSKSHQKYHVMEQKSAGGAWEGRPRGWRSVGREAPRLEERGKEGPMAGKWADPNGERRRAKASPLCVLSSLGLSQNPPLYSYSHLTKIAPQPPWSGADSSCGRPIPTTKRWCIPAFCERLPSFGQGLQYYKDSFPILLPTIILHLMATLSKLLTYSLCSTPSFPSHCFVLICIKLQFL